MLPLTVLLLLCAARAAVLDPTAPVDIFVNPKSPLPDGVTNYRIPALVRTASGVLVAFAEARTGGDCSPKWLVARRSADNGSTWSSIVEVAGAAPKNGMTTGNPAVGYDAVTKTIVVAYAIGDASHCNPTRSMMVLTDGGSDGLFWTAGVNISASVGKWAGGLPGPGTLAQLPSGRLIFPAHLGAYVADGVIISDDHGATWAPSASASASFRAMDEAVIAATPAGALLLNMRNAHDTACKCRATSRSSDGGETWSAIAYDATLIEPVCQASLVPIAGALYFSNPASTSARANITVRRSDDDGASWLPQTFLVYAPDSAGYSCMAAGGATAVIAGTAYGSILYEAADAALGVSTISFRLFPLDVAAW